MKKRPLQLGTSLVRGTSFWLEIHTHGVKYVNIRYIC